MPRETSLDKLYEQQTQLNALIKQKEQKLKAEQRKRDTKIKVLIGAMIQACLDKEVNVRISSTAELKAYMDVFLTRDYERSLFGLQPRATTPHTTEKKAEIERSKQSLATKGKKGNVHLPLEQQSTEQPQTNSEAVEKKVGNHATVAEEAASLGNKSQRLREVPIEATALQDEFNL